MLKQTSPAADPLVPIPHPHKTVPSERTRTPVAFWGFWEEKEGADINISSTPFIETLERDSIDRTSEKHNGKMEKSREDLLGS